MAMNPQSSFTITPTGDPYNRNGWDVTEHEPQPDGSTRDWFRGDLSPIQGKDNAIYRLNRLQPGCKVKVKR